MAEYRLSKSAENDLAEIADYTIATFGIEQSRRYRDGLNTCFQNIADNPMLGRSASLDFAPELRRYEYQSHVVFYMPELRDILIVRVLHKSMDAPRHL
jgi:toxin ParE1/3/4